MLIEIESLNLKSPRGDILLNNFSLKLNSGDRLGITGPSGCGKSTLLKSIANGIPNNLSSWSHFDIKPYLQPDKFIGYAPQAGGLPPWYPFGKTLEVFNSKVKVDEDLLRVFGLLHKLKSFPSELSGGEYQRAVLAMTIHMAPCLYLIDEPLTEVDLKKKWEVLSYWSNKIDIDNSALIVVSHDIDTLAYMCNKVLLLEKKSTLIGNEVIFSSQRTRKVGSPSFEENRKRLVLALGI